ncbi:MAG: M48 family metalloprotease [Deltaproteobacteria bacterium]|nr:M48 family metalloprotease [Deltaproteobacteria bacterium]
MSFRTFVRRTVLGVALAGASIIASSAAAQVPGVPTIPGMPGATPTIPGIPPGMPGGPPTSPIPGLPPGAIPSIPPPGGTPAIPNIPGMPGFKLFSPTGALLMPVMKDEAKKIYQKEIDSLSASRKATVEKIPLLFEDNKEEINAFAGCDDTGKTFVVVTAGMYQMLDLMAQTRATDETFGTGYYDEYIKELAKQQEGKAKILPLPPGMLDLTKSLDQRKLKRQRQLFDESIAYVLGHELAHHYMGHLGSVCTGGGGGKINPGDIIRFAKKVVPAVNQANEIQSDVEGVNNLLTAGQNESEYKWSEGGALLVIDFFKKLRDLHPGAPLFTFMMTHPAPEVRAPVVKNTANWWRLTHPGAVTGNGNSAPSSTPKLPVPGLPGVPGVPSGAPGMPSVPGLPVPGVPGK